MEKMRVGIIGIGFIGAAHIEALRRLGYVDVVALADAQGAEEKAAQLAAQNGGNANGNGSQTGNPNDNQGNSGD